MKPLCLILLVTGGFTAHAQHAINWSKIAGGGATTPSTGGVYAVSGTLGQPDASGALTNGAYVVSGGFWPGVHLLQTPGAPPLAAEPLGGGNVRVYWPRPATGFVLDQTTALGATPPATVWSQVPFPYATNATHISITVPAAGDKFYRLRKP